MKKNILVDTSFIMKNKTGIGQYTLNILKAMDKIDSIIAETFNIDYITLNYKFIWQTIYLNTIFYLKSLFMKHDFVIFPNFIMPYFTNKKMKYVTIIYDLSFLRKDEMTKYHSFIFNLSTNIALKKADIIVTDSQTVKKEIINMYNYPENKIKVVYTVVGEHFINTENNQYLLEKYNLKKGKYILSVATLNKRKNIPTLVKAFEQIADKYPDLKLVLVGGMGNENREKLSTHPNVIFTGYIPDEDLPTLYKNAMLYAYPSLYEGFGIPLIEAQYCNCPVLCSDIPVFREVAGGSAEFCEPTVEGFAEKLEYLLNNPARREELAKLGTENVKRFSIEKIAEQLKEVIQG